jgi:hypothetical protein
MFQLCLGISWTQPATPEAMTYMRNLLPPGSPGSRLASRLYQFPMVAQALLLGGHVRVEIGSSISEKEQARAPQRRAGGEGGAYHRGWATPGRQPCRGTGDPGAAAHTQLRLVITGVSGST